MSRNVERFESSLASMCKLGRALTVVFTVFIVATVLAGTWALIVFGSHEFGLFGAKINPEATVVLPALLLLFVQATITELIILSIGRDMAHGVSPLTRGHAWCITALGVLFFLAMFISPHITGGGYMKLSVGPFAFVSNGAVFSVGDFMMAVDIPSLMAAVVSFSIATIFHYGSLLQEQTEDLV